MSESTRWLTPEQTRAWIALMGTVIYLPAALDAQLRRDADLSHAEYQVMSWLSMTQGRTARMSELASMAYVSLSHLSRIVSRLEQRGWVSRAQDPDDRRATLATLNEDGWRKVVQTAPGHVEEAQRLVFDALTDAQVAQLRDIGEAIVGAVRPDVCLAGPQA